MFKKLIKLPRSLRSFTMTSAFTMAEILLSLTIIGVVAAITLPSLTGNINERTWNTQRKALHSRLSQAAALLPQIRGYGSLNIGTVGGNNYDKNAQTFSSNNATEAFLTNGLAKVFKLNNICDADHLNDCGIPDQIIKYGGEKISLTGSAMRTLADLNRNYSSVSCANYSTVHTLAGAFETANGESILVHYNPLCKDNLSGKISMGGYTMQDAYVPSISLMCANFIYDLNGKKGPNTMGKDVGIMTLFYPDDSVLVSADLVNKSFTYNGNWQGATQYCKGLGDDSRLANFEELAALTINRKFLPAGAIDKLAWSSKKSEQYPNQAWVSLLSDYTANMAERTITESSGYTALCVRRSN